MCEEKGIRQMVDEDIAHSQALWAEYSYDKEKMAELFRELLLRYDEKIEGFHEDLWVIQNRESSADAAAIYRHNIRLLLERLEGFRENGYTNEGLLEYYIRKEQRQIDLMANFTSVRLAFGMRQMMPLEKEEIMERLDEMEEICSMPVPKGKKWEMLRGHLVWLSGKDVETALQILPLFFRINDMITQRIEDD